MNHAVRHIGLGQTSDVWPESAAWFIGSAFLTGTLLELSTHPKPGLVTPRSNGAHRDMNLQTFMVSSAAIAPCFYQCAEAGLTHFGAEQALLPVIRGIGSRYEQRLLAATNGINTQRGLLFSAGILSGVAGLVLRDRPLKDADELFELTAAMTKGLCQRELGMLGDREPKTAGEKLYRRYGVLGIRGEVEAGFPTVRAAGLPALRSARERAASLPTLLLHTLISLMSTTEDTTVLWRGGLSALDFVRDAARRILDLGGAMSDEGMAAIAALDAECITRNISPGGSADLLAITVGVDALLGGHLPSPIAVDTLHTPDGAPAP